MPRKSSDHFAEADDFDTPEAIVAEPSVVVNNDLVTARVKGTWKMFWGTSSYDFKDGSRYRLPRDLFYYLKKNGNIYDTMS